MKFFFKQRKTLLIYDSSESYGFSSFKQIFFLHLIVLNFSLKNFDSQKKNLSKNGLSNLQLKALLFFYLAFSKYSYFNFKTSKNSSGYAFKIILRSFIAKNIFLNFLLINSKIETIMNTFEKIKKDSLIPVHLKYLNFNLFFKATILFINTDLFSMFYKSLIHKNFFITANILFKNNKLFLLHSIKSFYKKNLLLPKDKNI